MLNDFAFSRGLVASALGLALVACGGGGGGGGGSPAPNPAPSPSPSPTPSELANLPAQFAFSVQEEEGIQTIDLGSFTVTTTSTEEPTNVQLSGTDASVLNGAVLISFTFTQATANTINVDVGAVVSRTFNFEAPEDADQNNVYELTLAFTYRGQNYTRPVTITVTDIPDAAEATGATLVGEAFQQAFAGAILSIPDVSGDGKPDVALPILVGVDDDDGPASAYLLSSEFLEGFSGRSSISAATNFGARFDEQGIVVKPAFNFLSAAPNTSGAGVDLLLSEASQSRMLLFTLDGATDFAAIQGEVDTDTIPGAIAYALSDSQQEGRLIADINNDNDADIFIRELSPASAPLKMGIIFGGTQVSANETTRSADFDITFTTERVLSFGRTDGFFVETLPDLDGDTLPELVIGATTFGAERLWYIRGAALSTSGATIDLDTLSGATGWVSERAYRSVATLFDHDNDGLPLFAFGSPNFGVQLVDGDDLNALDPATAVFGFGDANTSLDATGFAIGGFVTNIGDLDGDALAEITVISSVSQKPIVIPGALLQDVVNGTASNELSTSDFLTLDLTALSGYPQHDVALPVNLEESGLLAFGFVERNYNFAPTPESSGHLVLVPRAAVESAFQSGATELELQSGN